MLIAFIAMYAIFAPASYLAAKVWAYQNGIENEMHVAIAAAFLPPMGAVLALIVLTQDEVDNDNDDGWGYDG